MSEQEFESYLRLLARFLHLSSNQREAIARELRAHMEDRLEDLLARGYTREEAIQTALDEFGDAAALAGDFGRIGRRRRWIMRTTTATIGIAAAVLLVSFLMPEHRAWLPAPAFTHAGQSADDTQAPAGKAAENAPIVAPPGESASAGESVADRLTTETLQRPLPTVDLAEGTTLADAIEFLRTQTKLSVNVNWGALAAIGVEKTSDIGGLNLHDVKAETALNLLLDNVSQASGGVGRATYIIMDGIIRISTTADLNTRIVVRIYDCRDLLGQSLTVAQKEAVEAFAGDIRTSTPSTQPSTTAGGVPMGPRMGARGYGPGPMGPGMSGGGYRGQPGADARYGRAPQAGPAMDELLSAMREKDTSELTRLITDMVEPGTWQPDGPLGAIGVYDGLLVVRHTPSAQQQVAGLLRGLRQAKAARQAHAEASTSPGT